MEKYWNIDGDMDTRPELDAVRESFREGATNIHVRDDMERYVMTFKFTEREKEMFALSPIYADGVTELKVLERERDKLRKFKRWAEASIKRGSGSVSDLEFYWFMIGLMNKRIRKERTNERKRCKAKVL